VRRVVVHIDRLVLKGIGHAAQRDVAGALQSELARLLGKSHGADNLIALGNVERLSVAPIRVAAAAAPKTLGAQAAQSIVTGSRP
jgi:hypothetical protein